MEDDSAAVVANDSADIQPPESIENFDLSSADGNLGADQDSQSANDVEDFDEGESEQQDNADESQSEGEDINDRGASDSNGVDLSKMTEGERNSYFAQQRIERRDAAKRSDESFLENIRSQVKEAYIDVDPNEENYELMEPEVANQLRELSRANRQAEAERKLGELQVNRQNVSMSVMDAETRIPMFNEASPEYNEDLKKEALSDWAAQSLEVVQSQSGELQVVGLKEGAPSAYEYLKDKADFYKSLMTKSAARGQQAARRNRANSDSSQTARSGSTPDSDADLEARVANIPLA